MTYYLDIIIYQVYQVYFVLFYFVVAVLNTIITYLLKNHHYCVDRILSQFYLIL